MGSGKKNGEQDLAICSVKTVWTHGKDADGEDVSTW